MLYSLVDYDEEGEETGVIDPHIAERIQLGQFDPMYLDDIRNSKYALFLNWANE